MTDLSKDLSQEPPRDESLIDAATLSLWMTDLSDENIIESNTAEKFYINVCIKLSANIT